MNRPPHLTELAGHHLTAEQLYSLLDTTEGSDSAAGLHLRACPACASELAHLSSSIACLRTATTGFAALHTPSMAARSSHAQEPALQKGIVQFLRRQAWAASLATAAVAVAVSVSLMHPVRHGIPPVSAPQAVAEANSTASIPNESDEALLDGIQRDLSTSVAPSLEPLQVSASTGSATTSN